MKMPHLFPIACVLASLALSCGCAATSPARTGPTSTPRIADIGGIQIGYSTQDELERAWGPGLTVVGGHPNSGRRWRVRGTDWVIATDGFLYSDRGLVIDSLTIESQPALSMNVPFARLDRKSFAWLGEISCTMTRSQVIAALHRQTMAFKEDGQDLDLDAEGFSEITSEANASFHHWQATLLFKDGKLNSLQLDAGRALVSR